MTAKEMLEQATMITDNVNGTAYFFTEPRLKDFIEQLCKEQRELCVGELEKKVLMDIDETKQLAKIVVLNAPQPQIFKEGNA